PGAHGGDVPPPQNNSCHAQGLSLRRCTNSFPDAQTHSHTFAPCSHPEKTHAPSYRDPLRTNLPWTPTRESCLETEIFAALHVAIDFFKHHPSGAEGNRFRGKRRHTLCNQIGVNEILT